ncbi:hypothetical protein [Nitrogeniibacter aestuarii]|uniref:hypothetical protein n=1 Tax=Nitrogeniibacter aestuarii TaxID=2815343 RepID=UPI001D129B17|nr:hypothetical protein [Nitrogeniibacter aestuarii]
MSAIDKLTTYLDLVDNDYWHDVACLDARRVIDTNGIDLLERIFVCCAQWPENRLEHFAYILDGGTEVEIRLLRMLAESEFSSVAFRAREVLRAQGAANA